MIILTAGIPTFVFKFAFFRMPVGTFLFSAVFNFTNISGMEVLTCHFLLCISTITWRTHVLCQLCLLALFKLDIVAPSVTDPSGGNSTYLEPCTLQCCTFGNKCAIILSYWLLTFSRSSWRSCRFLSTCDSLLVELIAIVWIYITRLTRTEIRLETSLCGPAALCHALDLSRCTFKYILDVSRCTY